MQAMGFEQDRTRPCRARLALAFTLTALACMLAMAAPSFATSGATGWGANEQGQLGDGSTTSSDLPVAVSGLGDGVATISAGSNHSLALLTSGAVEAWGENGSGQLGNGTTTGPETCPSGFSSVACATTPEPVAGLSGVRSVSAGGGSSFALLKGGTIMSWGSDFAGALGDGGTTDSAVPVAVSLPMRAKAVSADGPHALALVGTGKVMAWGDNEYGQLGDGTHTGPETCPSAGTSTVPCSTTPVAVTGLREVVAISAGDDHNLALLKDGTVVAWGANNDGQLGDNTTTDSDVPVPVSGLTGVRAISAGGFHSLALLSDGTVMAWGDNGNGQLGDGTIANKHVPVPVTGLSSVTAISAGLAHSLALLSDGTVKAWGWNENGQLGNGTPHGESTLALPVVGLSGVATISAGGYHSLADSPPPAITKVSPRRGPAGGGTTVTITGTNPTGATSVEFGSTPATSYTVNSPSSITATSPPETPGLVDVRVTTPNGTSAVTSRDHFRFLG
jgi:alpha-tubulin suppressor-like RCC1 family protein